MSADSPFQLEPRPRSWYRRLVKLYPGGFHDLYAAEMLRVFDEDWSRVAGQGGMSQTRYWIHVLCDLVRTMPGEWLAASRFEARWIPIGMFAGAAAAYLTAVCLEGMPAIAYCLFLSVFAAICWAALARPSQLGTTSSFLRAGFLITAGCWIAKLLAQLGSSQPGPQLPALRFFLVGSLCLIASLALSSIARRRKNRMAAVGRGLPYDNTVFRLSLEGLCFAVVLVALAGFSADHGYRAYSAFFAYWACRIVGHQLSAVWWEQGKSSTRIVSPDQVD